MLLGCGGVLLFHRRNSTLKYGQKTGNHRLFVSIALIHPVDLASKIATSLRFLCFVVREWHQNRTVTQGVIAFPHSAHGTLLSNQKDRKKIWRIIYGNKYLSLSSRTIWAMVSDYPPVNRIDRDHRILNKFQPKHNIRYDILFCTFFFWEKATKRQQNQMKAILNSKKKKK